MVERVEETTVVVIGAGVAGLTLGNFLLRRGIRCTVLERCSRDHVERRQRAGTVDSRGVRMFREWGLAEVVEAQSSTEAASGFWVDGEEVPVDFDGEDLGDSAFCPQQVLVRNLTEVFLRGGGDLRYEALEVALADLDGARPVVRYRDGTGAATTVSCDLVAGCDGDRGVSRASVPAGALTRYACEFGYAWLSALAAVPTNPVGMAIHSRGLAGLIPRGAAASRLYLQCGLDDTPQDWPDERVWSETAARFGRPVDSGRIVSKQIVPLRSVVYSPMRYGSLVLLGDAAHIVPPMSAKGIHLALYDADLLARAVDRWVHDGDPTLLDRYSADSLAHVWNYQAFATWITEMMHNAGDATHAGEFRKQVARAELRRQFTSAAANRLFGELASGLLE